MATNPLRPSLEITDPREVLPGLFDQDAERVASGGQMSAAILVAVVLLLVEAWAAPYILGATTVVAVASWILLNSSLSGRRRSRHRRRLSSRLLYISTLFLLGLWLVTMLLFKMATPQEEISGAPKALPQMVLGMDVRMLAQMAQPQQISTSASMGRPVEPVVSPFSVLVHGAASTIGVNLFAYVLVTLRRRQRRQARQRASLTAAPRGR